MHDLVGVGLVWWQERTSIRQVASAKTIQNHPETRPYDGPRIIRAGLGMIIAYLYSETLPDTGFFLQSHQTRPYQAALPALI